MKKGKTEIAYEIIKQKLIMGEIKPLSDISEDLLSQEIGISRTPIREALKMLEKEGFVVIYPRKGTFASGITSELINHIYEVREAMEPYLARNVCGKLERNWLEEMQRLFSDENHASEKERLDFIELDNDLHIKILSYSQNPFIQNVMQNVLDHNHRIRVKTSLRNDNYKKSIAEHRRIIDAYLQNDPEKVETSMREHIKAARKVSFEALIGETAFYN